MGDVMLLGDSVFDNKSYVGGEPSVIEHLRAALPSGWSATLLAVDGAMIDNVAQQLHRVPSNATHLVVSVGGNNALTLKWDFDNVLMGTSPLSAAEVQSLKQACNDFAGHYSQMLDLLCARGIRTTICTIYDAIPGLSKNEIAVLSVLNQSIIDLAAERGVGVIDLRLICNQESDFAAISPIEPSSIGGAKIAAAIADMCRKPE